jgi:acyl-CoA synthetase (AMP-forming)/AMP-acid ligase II
VLGKDVRKLDRLEASDDRLAPVDTIYDRVLLAADRHPEKPAIISGVRRITYGELRGLVSGLAKRLASLPVGQGDRVGIAVSRKLDHLIAVIGTMGVGGVPVPLPAANEEALRVGLAHSNPAAIIGDRSSLETVGKCDAAGMPILADVAEIGDENAGRGVRPAVASQDLAMIFYTSGTTSGVRTGVMITYGNLKTTVTYLNGFMGVDDSVVEYVMSPVDHAFGFGRCRAVLEVGGTAVLEDGLFNPAQVLVAMERQGCNALSGASTGFAMLLEYYERDFRRVGGSLRWAEIGSVPMRIEHKHRLLEILPTAKICMNYGLTEAMRSTLIDLRSEIEKIGTVGRSSPGVEIRIRGEKGEDLSPGHIGEVWIRGPNVAKGFWRNEALWRQRCRHGWLRTGDFGHLDPDGYLTFTGRQDDLINLGGEKLSALEIEERLKPFMGHTRYCVCAAPDPAGLLGEVPVLCVEGSVTVAREDIRRWLGGLVESHKIPRSIRQFGELPTTFNGKIRRTEVRRILREGEP